MTAPIHREGGVEVDVAVDANVMARMQAPPTRPGEAGDRDRNRPGVLLLGGGSGGHVLPGLAVAEALGGAADCIAVCSQRPVDAAILERAGMPFLALPASPPSPRPEKAIRFLRGWRHAAAATRTLVRERSIDVVLCTGGFVSPPVASAARRAGVPVIALCLDVVPGRAIRLVGRFAGTRLAGGPMPDAPARWRDALVTGVPVRRDALAQGDPAACRTALGLDPDRPTLLITGASQGARTLDELAPAVARAADRPMGGWQVIHLTGGGDPATAAAAWTKAEVPATVLPFLDRMGLAWGAADLAVSRAGAGSVAEASANRVPTIFLPYPWHADQHQARNAAPLAEDGGAIIRTDHVDTDRNLADAGAALRTLLGDAAARTRMRAALARRPRGDAAAIAVAEHVLAAAGRRRAAGFSPARG